MENGRFSGFGSPVFVLDKKLQDGDTLSKWKPRSWVGVYVGHSIAHSGNVPVIYNPQTTHITPQFHVVFDDQFSTVTRNNNQLTDNHFAEVYHNSSWLHKDEDADIDDLHLFDTYWSNPPMSKSPSRKHKKLKCKNAAVADDSNAILLPHTSQRDIYFPSEADHTTSESIGDPAHSSKLAIRREHANTSDHAQLSLDASDTSNIPRELAEQSAPNEPYTNSSLSN